MRLVRGECAPTSHTQPRALTHGLCQDRLLVVTDVPCRSHFPRCKIRTIGSSCCVVKPNCCLFSQCRYEQECRISRFTLLRRYWVNSAKCLIQIADNDTCVHAAEAKDDFVRAVNPNCFDRAGAEEIAACKAKGWNDEA